MNQDIQNISTQSDVPKDARNWGMICHLVALAGFIVPFGNILGPLIVWVIKKDEHGFIDDQGKEAINFQLTMTLALIGSVILIFILIGFFLIFALCIFVLVMTVVAAVKANEGVYYRYPLTIRFFN
ncbi:MAG: DUF4870 domain-containing protein [Gammaproteobacteria bacterium]